MDLFSIKCKDCARFIKNEKFDDKSIMSAEGYCEVPVRIAGGLLGTVEAGEHLNILFARGVFNCNNGKKWFLEKTNE